MIKTFRKLRSIISVDVSGDSLLPAADDTGTVNRLNDYR
jgi:hypothetical protein